MYDRPAKILNVASTAGITSRPGWLAYASSKAAVVSMSATLADELAGSGIKVYSISPGRTATELRRKLAPEEDPTHDHAAGPRRRRHRPADERRRDDPRRAEHRRPHPGLSGRMSRLEYLLASALLLRRPAVLLASCRSGPDRVVLATARVSTLDGNLLHLHRAMVARHPELDYVLLLEPYSYGLARQARLPGPAGARDVPPPDRAAVRGRQRLSADPRRAAPAPRRRSSRSGTRPARSSGSGSTPRPRSAEPERTFLHRYYDAVVVGGEWTRAAVCGRPPDAARARPGARLAADRLLLRRGGPGRRPGARPRRAPGAGRPAGRPLRADVPRPRRRQAGGARAGRGPRCGPPCRRTMPSCSRPTRTSTRRRRATAGYDVVVDPTGDINDLLRADRHPHHRLLVVDRRVRAARAGRSSCSSATSPTYEVDPGPVPRLPDRDDRHAGGRHRRGHRRDRDGDGSTCPATTRSSSGSSARRVAGPATASSTTSSAAGRRLGDGGDTLPPDVRHE